MDHRPGSTAGGTTVKQNATSACNALKLNPRLSELSAPRQALVRLCQSIDYGQVLGLVIRDREPTFNPAPTVLLDVKLDADCGGRPESELGDFTVRDEIRRLLDRIDELEGGRFDLIEVRAGIPRRVVIQRTLTEAR
jgi:hypothetical protein